LAPTRSATSSSSPPRRFVEMESRVSVGPEGIDNHPVISERQE
jgi:hypothetical protein